MSHIKDATLNETYLTKEKKITLTDILHDGQVYVSIEENLNDAELKIVSTMPTDEIAKVDAIAEEENKPSWWKFWKKGDK